MIYINCPSCDAHGRVPEDRVNKAIVCKKCLNTFHVKPSGHAVGGGPPTAERDGSPHVFDQRLSFDEWLDKFNSMLRKLVPLATTLAVVLIVVGGYLWVQPPLEDRVATVATALARGDQDAIRGLAVSGTDDAAVKWLEELHPQVSASIQATPSVVPIVTVIAKQGDPQDGAVAVRARISPEMLVGRRALTEDVPASASVVARSIDVPLMLESGAWSGWLLDGKRTLEAFEKKAHKSSANVGDASGAAQKKADKSSANVVRSPGAVKKKAGKSSANVDSALEADEKEADESQANVDSP